ncbi:enoyl-CoA hydratase/isomerase family protein [Streptomyces sp. NPDC007861]|uniref:enoyl-CoA hydratase/isomerase family protein n=1 Tax=Streptomyces sp. NPDC007861 TaxID=3154893 RepID=UPI0033C360C0
MTDGRITCETRSGVALVTLDRPAKLNAVTPEMSVQLARILGELDADGDVRCVVLTGAGERAFCVGSDIRELDRYDTPWAFRNRGDYGDAVRALRTPVVAAVGGYAFGGGLELALACDIRLAATSATFAAPEIKLGWIGGSGMAAQLTHSIGASNAALMLLTGDPVDADQALAWGLVSQVVADGQLIDIAVGLAGRIAARAPIAAQTAKANLRAAHSMPLDQAIQYERDLQTVCFATRDAAEGRSAFAERREPRFEGH